MVKAQNTSRNRTENFLAVGMLTSVGAAILCLFTLLIANMLGASELPVIFIQIAWFGLPLGALFLIALLVTAAINKRRE
jgi:hypothetical protein